MTMKEELLRAVRDEINDYEQTVNAILSFAAFVVHDGKSQRPGSEFGIGRRMTTSPDNSISPSSDITPDLVAQKSQQYGIVAEVKKTLDQNQFNWNRHIKQLRKYDDKLEGWWTEDKKIRHTDTIMLIHHSRSRPFARFLQYKKGDDPDLVGLNICVVEFNHSVETVAYYFFRLEFGNIRDTELCQRLEDGIPIPLDDVRMSFPNIQFYDTKPPIPLLLSCLWTDVFSSRMEDGEYDEKTKSLKLKISASDITVELQKAFGSKALKQDGRSGEFPKHKWVREAFERLIKYKLAAPCSGDNDKYTIHYRSFRDDVLNRFIKFELDLVKGDNKKGASKKQKSLFPNLDE